MVVPAQCHANMLNNYTICYSVCTGVCVCVCVCVCMCVCVCVCVCTRACEAVYVHSYGGVWTIYTVM